MDLWGRAKNLLYSLLAPIGKKSRHGSLCPHVQRDSNPQQTVLLDNLLSGQRVVWSTFRDVAERHLHSGSPPEGLEELHQRAELWAFNTDFSLEFPQPLMPHTVLVGGLLNKAAEPLDQVPSLDKSTY